MKIKTKTVIEKECSRPDDIFRHAKGDVRDIKLASIDFCCNDAEDAWGEFIVWGDDDRYLNKTNSPTIIKTCCYPSGTVMDYLEIQYCPFCGKRIEIENIETVEA